MHEFQVTIGINGTSYPTRIDAQIRYHINSTYVKEYYQAKHGWNESIWRTIDFAAFGRYFKSLPLHKRIHHMKFVHDLQPIGVHKARRTKLGATDQISKWPCSYEETETQLHLLNCRKNPARREAVKELKSFCRKGDGTRFFPVIGDFFSQWLESPGQTPGISTIANPYKPRFDRYPAEYVATIRTALIQQTQIGWLNMCRGCMSKNWHKVASCHFSLDDINSEVTSRNDGARRIQKFQSTTHYGHHNFDGT